MLNEREQTLLEEIERGFVTQDPDFVARICGQRPARKPRAMTSVIIIGYAFGFALTIGGIAQASIGLLVSGVVVLVAVGLFHSDKSAPDEHS